MSHWSEMCAVTSEGEGTSLPNGPWSMVLILDVCKVGEEEKEV